MTRHMLDTNTVSHLLKAQLAVVGRVVAAPMASLCVSAITEGELLFGLAKRPGANRLHLAVWEFLRRIDVLPWGSAAAQRYGAGRAEMERIGKVPAPLDMLIAAHALSVGAVLVTNDQAFSQVAGLDVEDWRADSVLHQGAGTGRALLRDALLRTAQAADIAGMSALLVDVNSARLLPKAIICANPLSLGCMRGKQPRGA